MRRLDERHFCRRYWIRGLECPGHGELVPEEDAPDEEFVEPIPVGEPPLVGNKPQKKAGKTAVQEAEQVLEAIGPRDQVPEKVMALYVRAMRVLMTQNVQGGRFAPGGVIPAGIPSRREVDAVIRGLARGLDVRELYDVIKEMQNIGPTRESNLAQSIREFLDTYKGDTVPIIPPPGRLPGLPAGGKSGSPAFFDLDAGHSILTGQSRRAITTNQARAMERAQQALDTQQGRSRSQRPGGNVTGGTIGKSVQFRDSKGRVFGVRVSKYSNLFKASRKTRSKRGRRSKSDTSRGDLGRRKK